jgi:hypothetical protein
MFSNSSITPAHCEHSSKSLSETRYAFEFVQSINLKQHLDGKLFINYKCINVENQYPSVELQKDEETRGEIFE